MPHSWLFLFVGCLLVAFWWPGGVAHAARAVFPAAAQARRRTNLATAALLALVRSEARPGWTFDIVTGVTAPGTSPSSAS